VARNLKCRLFKTGHIPPQPEAANRLDRSLADPWLQIAQAPAAPVFIDGKKAVTLRGPTVSQDFQKLVIDYIERRYGASNAGRTAAE